MRLIVVRHYKTLKNVSGQIIGWGDAPRVADWEADLAYVVQTLKANSIHVDVIYSSFLERARQSAMYFAHQYGIPVVHDTPALNEVNYGVLFEKPKRWVAEHIPEYKTDLDYVYPGGESFRQMQERSVDFVRQIACQHQDQTALVVVHAGVIRGLVCHFLQLELGAHLKRKVSHRYIGDLELDAQGRCLGYQEWGAPSGFLQDQVIGSTGTICDNAAGARIT
jgi:broad specificity phosphatase PhoE